MRVPGPFMSVTAANRPCGGSGTAKGTLGSLWAGSGGLWPLEYTNQPPEPLPTACQLVIAPDSKSSMTIVLGCAGRPMSTKLRATNATSAATTTAFLRPRTSLMAPRWWIRSRASRSPSSRSSLCSSVQADGSPRSVPDQHQLVGPEASRPDGVPDPGTAQQAHGRRRGAGLGDHGRPGCDPPNNRRNSSSGLIIRIPHQQLAPRKRCWLQALDPALPCAGTGQAC